MVDPSQNTYNFIIFLFWIYEIKNMIFGANDLFINVLNIVHIYKKVQVLNSIL